MASSTFKQFSFNSFGKLWSTGKIANVRKNEIIFSGGDRAESMFYVDEGLVKLTMTCRRGKEAIFGVCGRGDFFGEGCVGADQPIRLHNAVALYDTRIIKIDRSAIVKLLELDRDVSYAFITYLLGRVAQRQKDIVENLLDSSERRLARALSVFKQLDKKNGAKLGPHITQQILAEMIGTTRQRVNFLMMKRSQTQ